jgi:hypothetical protein
MAPSRQNPGLAPGFELYGPRAHAPSNLRLKVDGSIGVA